MKTSKLIPLYGPEEEEETRLLTTVHQNPPPRTHGMGTCAWVNNMVRHSSVMLVAHSHHMGDFRVLGLTQHDVEWVNVRVLTKTGEASIVLPWYAKFDLYLGQP